MGDVRGKITEKFGRIYSGPVHTKPEEFENAALFLRLGLQFTLKHRLSLDRKHFENEAYDDVTISM